jgi:hypothetical protein
MESAGVVELGSDAPPKGHSLVIGVPRMPLNNFIKFFHGHQHKSVRTNYLMIWIAHAIQLGFEHRNFLLWT